jgi:hypothetical protein
MEEEMILIDLNVQDGRGLLSVAVEGLVAEARLREYFRSAEKLADEFNYQQEQIADYKQAVHELNNY